jgi:hypothetical protein
MVEFAITGTDEDDEEREWCLADQPRCTTPPGRGQKAVEAMENLHTYWEDFRPTLISTEEECGLRAASTTTSPCGTRRICWIRAA